MSWSKLFNCIVTTSGGRMLVSNDETSIEDKYRMSNVIVGFGIGQLEVLDHLVAARRQYKPDMKIL